MRQGKNQVAGHKSEARKIGLDSDGTYTNELGKERRQRERLDKEKS